MLTLNDINVKGKTVFLRVDINSPIENGRLVDSERIRAHAKTIKELSGKGAKVVVLGHQGRKGDSDFLPLEKHAALLSKHAGKRIAFVPDVIGHNAVNSIKNMKSGEIVLLDNVRNLSGETKELDAKTHSKGKLVRTLAPLGDFFVNDAFSVSHRSHASVVGFTPVLKSVAGRVMENEVKNCSKFLGVVKRPFLLIMGGKKPDEVLGIIKNLAPKADKLLISGVIGELFLMASGKRLGRKEKWLKEKGMMGFFDDVKKLYTKHNKKLVLPVDFGVDVAGKRKDMSVNDLPTDYMIWDIGPETARLFGDEIKKVKMLIMKGTPGAYVKKGYETGTKAVLKSVEKADCFSLLGGGDTSTVVEMFNINKKKISYISLAGGALIELLSGKKLPGVEALK